jgi:hypothetical protein
VLKEIDLTDSRASRDGLGPIKRAMPGLTVIR